VYVRIGKAARMMGVSRSTMGGWDRKKLFKADYRTEGGHRRYSINRLLTKIGKITERGSEKSKSKSKRVRVVTYARVSSSKQKKDLTRQIEHVEAYVRQ
jgi:predicted site-specific integrase-resolvase